MNATTAARWLTIAIVIGVGIFAYTTFQGDADDRARIINQESIANEELAEGAPQQQVVASWAIQAAELEQVRQNGVRNGLLGICAAMLVGVAINVALLERRGQIEGLSATDA